jgi:tetratricopeptide (TPR) repeat protein
LLASAWLWFVAPLLPVSQMLISIENRMADRYLFLSVMGPALLAATAMLNPVDGRPRTAAMPACDAAPPAGQSSRGSVPRWRLLLGAVAVLVLGSVTAVRAHVFADSIRVWEDATAKTKVNGLGPYHLGMAFMEAGRDDEAIAALREAMARAKPPRAVGRKAATALSRLLARRGQLEEAEDLLRRAARDWPLDAMVLGNLAEVVARRGRSEEARTLFLDVIRRFPDYTWARDHYRERFGEP